MTVPIDEAQQRLPELIDQAAGGADVVISRGDGASFRLVPVLAPSAEAKLPTEKRPRKGGSARGRITMRDDFDDPIPGFEPYM